LQVINTAEQSEYDGKRNELVKNGPEMLGSVLLDLLHFFECALKFNNLSVDKRLVECHFAPRLITLFERLPHNNLLHNKLTKILRGILLDSTDRQIADSLLLKSLFAKDCNLLEFLMRVYMKSNDPATNAAFDSHGHLRMLANSVFSCTNMVKEGMVQQSAPSGLRLPSSSSSSSLLAGGEGAAAPEAHNEYSEEYIFSILQMTMDQPSWKEFEKKVERENEIQMRSPFRQVSITHRRHHHRHHHHRHRRHQYQLHHHHRRQPYHYHHRRHHYRRHHHHRRRH
jgi:hypothetical protein